MLKLTNVKLHGDGTLYRKFTFKNDISKRTGYLRVLHQDGTDVKWDMYEMIQVSAIDEFVHDRKTGKMKRVVKEQIAIESFKHKIFLELLDNMELSDEYSTITLRTYEDEILQTSEYIDVSNNHELPKLENKSNDLMTDDSLSLTAIQEINAIQMDMRNLLDNTRDKDQIYAGVIYMQQKVRDILRESYN